MYTHGPDNDTIMSGDQRYLDYILAFLESQDDNISHPVDFRKPYIKHSLKYVYPLFVFLHACVSLVGTFGNAAMMFVIFRNHLYRVPTFFFLANIAFADIIKAAIVLPITVTMLLFANWILGSFLCFFIPMMHAFPLHASMLSYVMIAADRYRFIVHPMKSRVPAGLCIIAVWVAGVCAVLPYTIYIKYIDLGSHLGSQFEGVGLCLVDMDKRIEEYIRAMFVVMYCLPLAIIAFLYVRVSAEIKSADSSSVSIHFEENLHSASDATYQTNVTWSTSDSGDNRIEAEDNSYSSSHQRNHTPAYQLDDDDYVEDMDYRKEKRTQKYMITMVMLFALCWLPINLLTLVTHFVIETDNNTGHFDVTYLTFTLFGFMSTCVNPVLFASWSMSDHTKDRLRGYFRFSNRRQSSPQSSVHTSTTRYTPSPKPTPAIHSSASHRSQDSAQRSHTKSRAHVQFLHRDFA